MENTVDYGKIAQKVAQDHAEKKRKYGHYVSSAPIYSVDSMRVVVEYTAIVGRVEYSRRGKGHFFTVTTKLPPPVSDSSMKESLRAVLTSPEMNKKFMEYLARDAREWQQVNENAYAIRDEFFKVKTIEQALEFLQKTGGFSSLDSTITWREFQKWQRIARMVQEHDQLASAMQSNAWGGECGEVLMALSDYPGSLFEDDEIEIAEFPDDTERSLKHFSPKEAQQIRDGIEEGKRARKQRRRALWQWFIRPPVSIEWQPNSFDAFQKVLKRQIDPATGLGIPIAEESPILRGGAMIEFLLPQDQLAPALFIKPKYTLEAIAAAIYAERIQGIRYKTCDWCREVFKIGKHKNKRYCDPPKSCKANAHKQRQRARQREEKALAASKHPKGKARQARRP